MKKILFAALFVCTTLGFTACDSTPTSTDETTDTTTLDQETTMDEQMVAPADTASMSADTTSAQ
jgi:starvation-inducible outer membrane lipoprotein